MLPGGAGVPAAVASAPGLAPPPAMLSTVIHELRTFVLGRRLVVTAQLDASLTARTTDDTGALVRQLGVAGLITPVQAEALVVEFHQAQMVRAKVFIDLAIARGLLPPGQAAHAFGSCADAALLVPIDQHLQGIGMLTAEQAAAMRGRAATRAFQLKATKYLIVLSGISAVLG